MSTNSMIHKAKLNEWATRLADQKASGLSVSEWCRQNNLSQHKYFYWKRLLKEEAVEQMLPEIVQLAMPPAATDISPNQNKGIPAIQGSTTIETRTTCASYTSFQSSPSARLYINGIYIELDASASEPFISSIIKAVRHA